jgi:xylulokinase
VSADCLLGIDIGTYSSKGVLVQESGRVIASAGVEHELSLPRPGYVEHDAEKVWWGDFRALARDLLASSGVDPRRIAESISTTSPGGADEQGTPAPAILWHRYPATAKSRSCTNTGAALSSQSARLAVDPRRPEVPRTRRTLERLRYCAG